MLNWKHIFVLLLLLISKITTAETTPFALKSCHLDGIKEQVKCGTLTVPENYQQPNGTTITINVAVLPAIDNSDNKTPLMFLAGGPGQAAVELAGYLKWNYREIIKTRDIILIDQRGTGKSHPLQCEESTVKNIYELIPEDFSEQEVSDCLADLSEGIGGDLSQYSSENAIRDFEAVRVALGHEKINIYGGSYGTRAALVYMRMFPDVIRSVVLDSVAPIEVSLGLFGQSVTRSFELLLQHCQEEPNCQKSYPNLRQEFKQVLERFEQKPVTLEIPHPRLGTSTSFVVSRGKFIGNLRFQLYSSGTRALVPLVIHQAFLGNYAPLAGVISQTDGGIGIYTALTFNIICSEDYPHITTEMFKEDANSSFGDEDKNEGFNSVCPYWPKYPVEEAFYQPVTANIPTLILSGNEDPVTPPSNGDYSAKTLPNSHHIVVKNNAHIVANNKCALKVVNEFLTLLTPKKLDESCLTELPAETFMTSLNGSI